MENIRQREDVKLITGEKIIEIQLKTNICKQ